MISGVSRTYDELEVGSVHRSRFGRTVLEADNVWFTLLTMNTNPSISTRPTATDRDALDASRTANGPFGPFSPHFESVNENNR
jgi:acyl dehydratase